MTRKTPLALLIAAALLGGCATTGRVGPVDVTRYHLGTGITASGIHVEMLTGFAGVGPEDQLYISAVAGALGRQGFTPGEGDTPFIAAVSYKHVSGGIVRTPPPVTIGLGGGTSSGGRRGGVGVGGGASFGIGGGRAEAVMTELSVQIRRRSDNSIVWEGRAVTEELIGRQGAQPGATAERLANALFEGFPGQSGITITVKCASRSTPASTAAISA